MPRYIDAEHFDERVRLAGGMSEDELTTDFKDGVQATLVLLSTEPTADVREVKHGEWKECEIVQERLDEPIIDEWQSARCSACGKYHTTPYMYYFDNFNYCPNCGARMDGGT